MARTTPERVTLVANRSSSRSMEQEWSSGHLRSGRHIGAGVGIAWTNLAILGALIGWEGGSRAYGTGLHTLFRDHLAAVLTATFIAVVHAALAARRAATARQLGRVLLGVLVADVVAALAVVAGIGEITLLQLPNVLFTQTVAGTQVLAVLTGLFVCLKLRGRNVIGAGEPQISAGP